MTDCTVAAPPHATKAPGRRKNEPASGPGVQIATEEPISDDEKTVASTAAAQLQSIYESHRRDLGTYASSLLLMAARDLGNIQNSGREADLGGVFHHAAAAVGGALAITRAAQPEGAVIGLVETAFKLLETADLGYGFELEPCEALAAGIRAADQEPCRLSRGQLLSVCEVAASNLVTVNQVLMQAQQERDACALAVLIDAAQTLTRHTGGMVDAAAGESVLGGHEYWNFGPNFASLGKAGAA